MKYSDLKKMLKTHSLRVTDCRIDVLQHFYTHDHALSFKDLEDSLTDYDRVTLYRTLNSFMDKGLLHRIPSDSGHASFGLCDHNCSQHQHRHEHVHFKCEICGHIECLSQHHVPHIDLPGYDIQERNLIVSGVCKMCNSTLEPLAEDSGYQ